MILPSAPLNGEPHELRSWDRFSEQRLLVESGEAGAPGASASSPSHLLLLPQPSSERPVLRAGCGRFRPVAAPQSALAALAEQHRLAGLGNTHLFLMVLEAGSPRSGYQPGWVLRRTFFLACTQLPSHQVPTWERGRHRERTHKCLWCLF